MAILTASTVVGMAILQHVLQPEMAAAQETPLFRLSALFQELASREPSKRNGSWSD